MGKIVKWTAAGAQAPALRVRHYGKTVRCCIEEEWRREAFISHGAAVTASPVGEAKKGDTDGGLLCHQSIFQRKAKCHKQVNETILRLTQELTLRTGMQETLASCAFHLYILEVVVSVRDVVQFAIGIVPTVPVV